MHKSLQPVHTHVCITKKKIYGLFKLIIFLTILLSCFQAVYNVTKRKYAYQKQQIFLLKKKNLT